MNDYTGHHNRTIAYDAGEYVSHPTGHALTISTVTAEQILDSRGNPTVRVSLRLDDGFEAVASAPAGASTGAFEAVELRDGGPAYGGLGVQGAVTAVRTEIGTLLTHHSYNTISDLDRALRDLDGTRAELPLHRWLSLVTGSAERMPVPHFNVLNGGAHATNALDFQEFMIAPVQAATEAEAVRTGAEIYHALARRISTKYSAAGLGDEGGFAPPIDSAEEALDLLVAAITDAGYTPGVDSVAIAMDPAANGFSLGGGRYRLAGRELARDELVDYYENLVDSYPIRSIEDGFAEDDHEGWIALSGRLADRIQLVGDDLYVTDAARILDGAHEHYSTAALIKPNQIGTVSQTLDAITAARRERVAKYNRLTQIEAQNPTISYGLA
ncbi:MULTISPECIES: phosphopyruvate hydratase [Subtercola]|uniref:Enolase n=1 Tax=Subtercola vilae TaxID=2056433 RepID=A0A4T2BZH9_9MICO|nr:MULTISPECIES: phosphopyruvate hydratase [Subtercola]MEA9984220.1 phosphopyruvate hydratase [Subtercola sp. RTI3]TIH37403.1 phosphopyruvate hydratase [Subtercola vilae]